MAFLSNNVKFILIDIYKEREFLDNEGKYFNEATTEWFYDNVKHILKDFEFLTNHDYVVAVMRLLPLFDDIHKLIYSANDVERFCDVITKWNCDVTKQTVRDWYDAIRKQNGNEITLHLLQITASMERLLGNVHLVKSSKCPFLLRDLLQSDELQGIFGPERMKLLQVLLGGPLSLNIRNLLWHGFVSPDDIPRVYFSVFLFIMMSFSQFIDKFVGKIKPRTSVKKLEEQKLLEGRLGGIDIKGNFDEFYSIYKESPFIPATAIPFFIHSLNLYKSNRYGDCVMLLLPQIEHLLRCRFASCNDRPDRMMTAETTEFYTTLDDILCPKMKNGATNKLVDELGVHLMTVLHDIFMLQDGLRLRDHLSHGEMSQSSVDENISAILLSIVAVLSHENHENFANIDKINEGTCLCSRSTLFMKLSDLVCRYEPLFHSLSFAKRDVVHCYKNIVKLIVKIPHELTCQDDSSEMNQQFQLCKSLDAITSQWLCNCDKTMDQHLFDDRIQSIINEPIHTLFRHGDTDIIIKQLSASVKKVSSNLANNLNQKTQMFEKKLMRSRQRRNFQRLLYCCPIFESGLKLITSFILVFIQTSNQPSISMKTLKTLLQICENAVTFTSVDVNKWDECIVLMQKVIETMSIYKLRSQDKIFSIC